MNTKEPPVVCFESYIMTKYPDLFAKDGDGNPLPAFFGFDCPTGWQHIVDSLCRSIDIHIKNPKHVHTRVLTYRIQMFCYKYFYKYFFDELYRIINPFEKFYWKDGKRIRPTVPQGVMTEIVNIEHPVKYKMKIFLDKYSNLFCPTFQWKTIPVQPVRIDQVKEKFGSMRFYFSGGDEHIRSIVFFAEVLTSSVCQTADEPYKNV